MFIKERKEAFTTSRIVSNFLDLEEYFQIERSLRSKMHYLSDPKKIPLRTVNEFKTRPKVLVESRIYQYWPLWC